MPIEKKEIEKIKREEAEIHNRILIFLTNKEGYYYSAKEVATNFNISAEEAGKHLLQLHMNSPIYYKENKYKSVDIIDIDGENFYGIV
jgi:hypothetical protein